MKSFKSLKSMIEFSNVFAYALDQETKVNRFSVLWEFLCNFNPDAVEEWRVKHNYVGYRFADIVRIMKQINVLTD